MDGNIQDPNQRLERTSFQEIRSYDARIDIKSDVAMVYGIDDTLPDRIALPSEPKSAAVDGQPISTHWDADTRTALLIYANSPEGRWVEVGW